MTPEEKKKQDRLKSTKPLVYEKMLKYDDMVARGESIAIINLQYTYKCNFRCQHCSISTLRKSAPSLSPSKVKDIFLQADEMGLAQVVITGGEPTLLPELDEVIAAINPEKFYIALESNGWLMTAEKIDHFKSLGIDKFCTSIDSFNIKDHDAFRRRKGSFSRAMYYIDYALRAGMPVTINTVAGKERIRSEEFECFLNFFTRIGAQVFAIYPKPIGEWQGRTDLLVDKSDMQYMADLGKQYNVVTHQTPGFGRSFGCIAVKRMFTITAYGDVQPCPYINLTMGNLFHESLRAILARGMRIPWIYTDTCLIGEDRYFVERYLDCIKGKELPVPYELLNL